MLGITVFNRDIHLQRTVARLPLTLGTCAGDANHWTIPSDDLAGRQCEMLPVDGSDSAIQIHNLGRPIQLATGERLHAGQQQTIRLPAVLWIGESMVRLFAVRRNRTVDCEGQPFVALEADDNHGDNCHLVPTVQRGPGIPTLTAWFQCLTELQRCAIVDQTFYRQAARALFDPGGLDAAIILLREEDGWRSVASYIPNPGAEISWSPELLETVARTKQTWFHPATPEGDEPGKPLVAAAPMLDDRQNVTGVVYGTRSRNPRNQRRGVRQVEAHFVRLVAQAVGAAMVRSRREAEYARSQALLHQVFPDPVVQRLRTDPQILEGQEKIVTTLFADIRGFSEISNRLSPRVTWQLISDVMDCWTEIVIRNSGAIVDYYGDGLAAFWNAPLDIENHAALAVVCAFRLRETLPLLNRRWGSVTGQPLEIGTGIATGTVQVGNCGSRQRIKYGPHGRSVNLARRLESLTSGTGIRILVSRETADQIRNDFLVRRLFRARVSGFAEPVEIWQPLDEHVADPLAALSEFERATVAFESGKFAVAVDELQSYLQDRPGDEAAQFLLGQARAEQGPLVELPRHDPRIG